MVDLRHQDWSLDSTSGAFGDFIANLCRRDGFEPRINARCKGFEMVAAMVASAGSVSIVPGLRVTKALPGIKAVRQRPEARRKISAAYRKGESRHSAVKVFLEQLVRTSQAVAGA